MVRMIKVVMMTMLVVMMIMTQVRLAKAMGNTVTAISTSPHKETVARYPSYDDHNCNNYVNLIALT